MATLYVVSGPNGSGKSTLTRTGRLNDLNNVEPDAIASEARPSGTHRSITSTMLASAVVAAANRAPWGAYACVLAASYTLMSRPDFMRFSVIGLPMLPRPTNPVAFCGRAADRIHLRCVPQSW